MRIKQTYLITLASIAIFFLISCSNTDKSLEPQANDNPIIANGLSNQKISAIAQDNQGYIWIGTFRGLNRYNTNEYHLYFCEDKLWELPDNQINDILLDSQDRLWIATVNGVALYTDQDNFKQIPLEIENKNCRQLFENKEGQIFINFATQLCVYNPDKEIFEELVWDFDPRSAYSIGCYTDKNNNIWHITSTSISCLDGSTIELLDSIRTDHFVAYSYLNTNGDLWLCGNNRVSIYNIRTRKYRQLPQIIANDRVLSESEIDIIHPYNESSILINTSKNGMFVFDESNNTLIHQDDTNFPFDVPKFKISTIYTDSQHNLWFGSVDQGITVRYSNEERFNNDNTLRTTFEKRSVIALCADKNDRLWISTLMDGLFTYDFSIKTIDNIDLKTLLPQLKEDKTEISSLFCDSQGSIWLGMPNYGVVKCKYSNNRLSTEQVFPIRYSMNISEDNEGTIWVSGAQFFAYGLKKGSAKFEQIQILQNSFTFVPGMNQLKSGKVLITAFMNNLNVIDPQNWNVDELSINDQYIKNSIRRSVFIPTATLEDSKGRVWIGTVSNGLLLYNQFTNELRPIAGATCSDISGLEEDSGGNIWVSTMYGLNKLDPETEKITSYYDVDGVGGNQFYDRSSCKTSDGTLVFGGTHGLTFFNPKNITQKREVNLKFENLKVHNRIVNPSDSTAIDKHLSHKPIVNLSHDQNSFSISFSSLAYNEFKRIRYQYKLEGFDNIWVDAKNSRQAYYGNIPAGCYKFRVRVTNNDKTTIEAEDELLIHIAAAPWNSWWAWCFYAIATIMLVFMFLRNSKKLKAEKEATRRAEEERIQELRINSMNMSFFANISHEFRTPLTMISGPITQLSQSNEIKGEQRGLLDIVKRNVDRMLKLVGQLMDFHKLENDSLKLRVKRVDVINYIDRIVDTFRAGASSKNITLNTYGFEDTFISWIDEDKIEKIISNLLSNALKFTDSGERVSLHFDVISTEQALELFEINLNERASRYIKVAVTDTGKGIAEEHLEKIFLRYYQIDDQKEGVYNYGTGIGLYYARSLAQLHHGFLKAANRSESVGSVFTLIVPVDDVIYSENERSLENITQEVLFPITDNRLEVDIQASSSNSELKTLLVVDDDTEVAHYLKVLLSPYYNVICRFNAQSAIKVIGEQEPDLVLSDVIMPDTNGYQLCKWIKNNIQFSHIPVVMVTANATIDSQVEGLDSGADAYVTKPFDPTYLLALINSQLRNREKVRTILGSSTKTEEIAENELSPQDSALMGELYKLMEGELSNSELDISHITEILKISRTKLYYKIKGLTGEKPSTFFRTYKLNRAAELIKEGRYNISEIADMTGFGTLSHFSTSFKKQFGVSPSEYNG